MSAPVQVVMVSLTELRALLSDEIRAALDDVKPRTGEEYLDSTCAAKVLGLHPKHVARLAKNGKLPGFRLGRAWRFSRADIDAFVKGRGNGQAKP